MIHRTWESALTDEDREHGWKLHVGDSGENYSFMMWDGEGGPRSKEGWWRSVEKLAKWKRGKFEDIKEDEEEESEAA